MSNEAAPASSLTDKEREAIAQMPYEEARDKRAQSLLGEVRAKLDAAQAEQATAANTAGTQDNLA